ncbi:hypothetical protein ABI59_23175 [Acidobacteria bacterium Mor1]|nr:hypothetical protein ABI59_23175 [Acidobacteria bacterium Mor1]
METLAPSFLIAMPQLMDPNFKQAVVLLLEQSEAGAMGVVVNRESDLDLQQLCGSQNIPYAGDPGKRIRVGGPVQPEQGLVMFGDDFEDPEAQPAMDGLRVSASTGTLSRLCNLPGGRFHCYTGYAGWGPGQLEQEIDEHAWIVIEADARTVLECPPEEMWRRVLTENGLDPAALVPGGSAKA